MPNELEVHQLSMPDIVKAKTTPVKLRQRIWEICDFLANAVTNPKGWEAFRRAIGSTTKKDSPRKHRGADRVAAAHMIVGYAETIKDGLVMKAVEGDIFPHLNSWMRDAGLGWKVRYLAMKQLTHHQPAE
jgi:hypothetical protein